MFVNFFSVDQLMSLGAHDLHQLACSSMGTLTTYRLLLGRCLLAFQRGDLCAQLGYSGAVHYACAALGMQDWRARELLRVASWLEDLPALQRAAEDGEISWCKLREVLRVATPEDEVDWLALCQRHTYQEIERRVREARCGEAEPTGQAPDKTELRLHLSPDSLKILERAFRGISQEAGRALPPAQALEYLCAEYLSCHGGDLEEKLEEARQEARLDLAAEVECSARNSRGVSGETVIVAEAEAEAEPGAKAVIEAEPGAKAMIEARAEAEAVIEAAAVAEAQAELWLAATASQEVECPGNRSLQLVRPASAHWQNPRLEFNPEARQTTRAQRVELLRRDGYRCRVPGCCNHLFLEVHHIKFYCDGGKTVPENLVLLCGSCHKNVHEGHLRIEGMAPDRLRFVDREGRDLAWQSRLELAQWLDFFVGWRGEAEDSHQHRLAGCRWEFGF